MTWTRICRADKQPRYIKRYGTFYVMTLDKNKATESKVPAGWEVSESQSGELNLRRS